MKIFINDKVSVGDLQQKFNHEFPYLKIEIFDNPGSNLQRFSKTKTYSPHISLRSCRKLRNEGFLEIWEHDTVEHVEKLFWDRFGLTIEIFRRSGNLWIETTLSDFWTLKRQNDEGEALTTIRKIFKEEDGDLV